MDGEIIARIDTFLKQNGSSINTISKSKIIQFKKIDNAIQTRIAATKKAKEILKSNAINISIISTDTGISRKTFYNNDLLRLFVESYSTLDDKKTVPIIELDRLKLKNDELLKQINKFVLRDIETENLRYEIKELNREIVNLQTRNDLLEDNYEKVQIELSKTKQLLASKNIILFNNKKL